jgi:LCP family protein required for cell wall assembly
MAGRRARARRTWPQRLLITFNVTVIASSVLAAGALGYLNVKLDEVPRVDLGDIINEPSAEPGAPQNYLLVGTDSAAGISEDDPITQGRENLGTNSDTIMVLRVEPGTAGAQLLSFPRDLWVSIPGIGENRINAAISAGGPQTLIQTIQQNFDIPINHYVEVDWSGFQGLVRAVDGVPMYFDKPVRDPSTGLNIPNTGCVTLDSDQALAFSRSRHLEYFEDGSWHADLANDLGRISRQQAFIRASIQRAIDKGIRNPITLNSLVNVGIDTVTAVDTELTPDDLIDLGTAFRSFAPEDLRTMTLDVYDDTINGAEVLRMQDTQANQDRLDIFKDLGDDDSEAGSVRIAINNGSGTANQATDVADAFAALGFDTSPGTGDAERFDFAHSVVRYAPGNEAVAQYVAAQIAGGADLQEVGSTYVADVIVVTGADYTGLVSELVPPPTPLPGGGDTGSTDQPTATTTPSDVTSATTTTQLGVVPQAPPGEDCT